jgi:hypothetical protein
MSRGTLMTLAVLLFSAPLARAAEEKPADPNTAVNAKLDRQLPEVNFKGQGLGDVLDFLRDVSGAEIFVNWRALEAVGVAKETPVTLKAKDMKFGVLLAKMFDAMGTKKGEPAFVVEGGVIVISTPAEMKRRVAPPKIPAELDRRLPEINFAGQGLSDVLDFLRDVTGMKIAVDWEALKMAKVGKETPVTARLRDVKLSTMMGVIFDDVGGGGAADAPRITVTFADGTMTIATAPPEDSAKSPKPAGK